MREETIDGVLRAVADKPDVILVGGQAIAVWVGYYPNAVHIYGDITSVMTRDIDFLASSRSAREIAVALDASIAIPLLDDATPNSAVLDLGSEGSPDERVDFLDYVPGPGDRVKTHAVTLIVPQQSAPAAPPLTIRIMHPLHCLQSKLENTVKLGRNGYTARSQLEATTAIVHSFIDETLVKAVGDHRSVHARSAVKTLDALGEYLERHETGRQADQFMTRDPLAILNHFADDERIPEPTRRHNIANAIARVTAMRARRAEAAR